MTAPRSIPPPVADAGDEDSTARRPARYDRRQAVPPTVSVIVPTYDERENIAILLGRLVAVLADFDHEIIVVDDDSPDGTWRLAEELAGQNHRIRVLRRLGRRGLSSAVMDGMGIARGAVLAVIDADLQHDEAVLPELISAVLDDEVDLCLGSREAPGGGYGTFGPLRRTVSWTGAQLARHVLGVEVSDPMSGFFAVSRSRYEDVGPQLNPRGFKIMLELLARGPRPRVAEVGYQFRPRTQGRTKLTSSVVVAYLGALFELASARLASATFMAYVAVAITGLSLRLSSASVFSMIGLSGFGSILAIETAVLFEFVFHNRYTFAGRPVRGLSRVGALFRFHLVSLHAVLALAGLASVVDGRLTDPASVFELSAALGLSTAGVMATVVVGYVLNRSFTWRTNQPLPGDGGGGDADPLTDRFRAAV